MGDTKRMLKNTVVIFIGSILAGAFSYLFNMLMGRLLGPVQYGELAAVLSLVNIFTVVGGVVMTTTMYHVGELYGLGNTAGIKKLLQIFSKYIFALSILFFFFAAAFAVPIANFFSLTHLVPVIIAFSGFLFGFVSLINKGILQGTQRFFAFSVVNLLEMILRVMLGVLLVKVGFSVSGAILATVLATVLTYGISFWPIGSFLKKVKTNEKADFHFKKGDILNYSWPVLASTLLLSAMLNLDIIMIKHYFPGSDAGLYAATSTVAKIILYITAPIISVMFPMILEKKAKGEKHYKMLIFALALTVIGALLVLGVFAIVPGSVMKVLYGSDYTALYSFLPQLGIYVLFYTLVNLLANYYLAIKNFVFIIFMALATATVLVWSSLYHPSILVVIRIFITSQVLLFAAMIGYYLFIKREQISQYVKGEYGE